MWPLGISIQLFLWVLQTEHSWLQTLQKGSSKCEQQGQQKHRSSDQQVTNDGEQAQSSQRESAAREPDDSFANEQVRKSSEHVNGQHNSSGPKAISRITEGYKVQTPILLSRTEVANENQKRTQPGMPQHVPFSTIYDKETGVRQVAWNPNEGWGGWAASGTGSGLVRIEDLAI